MLVAMVFFTFPEDARWNADREAVEFSVIVGEYHGTTRIARHVFQRLLDQSPTPQLCLEGGWRACRPDAEADAHTGWLTPLSGQPNLSLLAGAAS